MNRTRPEPMQDVKNRRDAALNALVNGVPYMRFLNITFERRGDELTGVLNFEDKLIGIVRTAFSKATGSVPENIEISYALLDGVFRYLMQGQIGQTPKTREELLATLRDLLGQFL